MSHFKSMTLNYEPSVDPPRPWFLNPAFVFYSTWLTVYFLYTLHLSNLLIFSNSTLSSLELPLLGAFLPMFFLTRFLPNRLYLRAAYVTGEDALELLDRRLRFWFAVWIALTLVEIIYSGGIPIVWDLTHSSKTYFDFGIPTLHGLLNGLLQAIALMRFALGIKFRRKVDFLYPLFTLVWAFIVVTRQEIIVVTLECAVVFVIYRPLKLKRILALLGVAVLAIVVFGISGDLRSDGDSFRQLAEPSDHYPTWLPSGFLWVYMYTTTPLNNLVNTWTHITPLYDITMPNTTVNLLPTAIRKILGNDGDTTAFTGDLVSPAFNVSTAYAGPFQDYGTLGIASFTSFAALVTGLFWRRHGMRNNLVYAVLIENLTSTIFYNHFLFLPIISQVFWFYLLFRDTGGEVGFGELRSTDQRDQDSMGLRHQTIAS